MDKTNFNNEFFNFITSSTCSFTCVDKIKEELTKKGYKRLYENEKWNKEVGKYFAIRNDASIIAFTIEKNYKDSFNIVCAHCDTPGFSLKPKNEIYEHNYLKINVAPYGGILNYGFMDRPLGISGRVIYKEQDKYKKRIINLEEPILVIPSEAIHQNNSANTDLDLNTQIDLIPILSLTSEEDIIKNIIRKHLDLESSVDICDYDLFLHSNKKPLLVGTNKEMILSPRIDDIACTFATFKSFIETDTENNINIMCIFNSEEIGSLTKEGADSSFLMDVLKRICALYELDISIILHNSLIISADNSHAVHPNHPNKSDVNNQAFLNKGVLVVREKDTTTDSVSSSIFKDLCKSVNVPFQDLASRNDMTTGSTLSGLCIRHVSVDSLDVGIPQLAMHSGNELAGADDTFYLYKVFKKFYDVSFKCENDVLQIEK